MTSLTNTVITILVVIVIILTIIKFVKSRLKSIKQMNEITTKVKNYIESEKTTKYNTCDYCGSRCNKAEHRCSNCGAKLTNKD